jgi:hypothetical protein
MGRSTSFVVPNEKTMAAAELQERTEQDRVEAWRLEELLRAGYPEDAATALAPRFDVDLHRAASLLRQGCPPEIAVAILI